MKNLVKEKSTFINLRYVSPLTRVNTQRRKYIKDMHIARYTLCFTDKFIFELTL